MGEQKITERMVRIRPVFDGKAEFKTSYIPRTGGSIYCQPEE